MRERSRRALRDAQKGRLNALLEETVKIEEAQIEAIDSHELKGFLDQVTHVKLRALREVTHEDLRGDRLFSIFLMQCENLSRKIQPSGSRSFRFVTAVRPTPPCGPKRRSMSRTRTSRTRSSPSIALTAEATISSWWRTLETPTASTIASAGPLVRHDRCTPSISL